LKIGILYVYILLKKSEPITLETCNDLRIIIKFDIS